MNNQSDWLISWRGTDLWNIRDIVLVIFSFLFLSYLFILFSIVQNDLWGILNVSNHDQSIRLVDFFQRALTSVKKVITLRIFAIFLICGIFSSESVLFDTLYVFCSKNSCIVLWNQSRKDNVLIPLSPRLSITDCTVTQVSGDLFIIGNTNYK